MVTIRAATVADKATVARLNAVVQGLHHDAHPELWKVPDPPAAERMLWEPLEADDAWAFIAEEDGASLGYVVALLRRRADTPLTVAGDFIELNQIAVLPEREHDGIGRELAARVLDLARELGVGRVELNVWEFNTRARGFFASLGFAPLQHRMALHVGTAEL